MQPKYNNSCIYKIVCLDPEIKDLYVGSTTNLTKRKNSHKTACNNPRDVKHNLYVYRYMRENGGFENWQFVVVRRYKHIETKEQLLKKERKYMERLKATLNKQVPTQTRKEYVLKNREKLIDSMKQYDEIHKEELKSKWGQQIECECGITYTLRHKNRHKNTQRHKQLMGEI